MKENPYKQKQGDIIRFDLLSINKNTQKLCRCKVPHFELDEKNRMVKCLDCGAVLDTFEALCKFASRIEYYTDYLRDAIETAKFWQEQANKEFRRKLRNGIFKDMERAYLNDDALPACPHCKKSFDPADITRWAGRKYCDYKVKESADNE